MGLLGVARPNTALGGYPEFSLLLYTNEAVLFCCHRFPTFVNVQIYPNQEADGAT
jgi:hypothetical protein